MKRVFSSACALALIASTVLLPGQSARSADLPAGQQNTGLEKIQSDPASGIAEYKLKSNGLQVLLAERHHSPIVTVMVVYHVGSRNEAVGYTGSTHFLEHMMFKGTAKHDPKKGTGIDDVLKPLGGINNATTSYDRTNYYEILPAQYLGTALELEADRMRNELLRKDDHDSEMTVVRNELERNEDDPGRLLDINLFSHAFVAHPYHHPVIGWRSDVENVPIERLRRFYNEFYYPNNATLVVIGDFQTPQALQLISKYFSVVPASPAPFPPVYTTEPPQEGERRFIVQRGEDLPKVVLGFHIPKATDKDTYALEVAASLLGDDRKQSSRLYKSLVDPGLVSDVYAYNYSLKDPSLFTLLATATPDTPSEKIESILFDQAQGLAHNAITPVELEKAKKSVWKRMRLETADPMGLNGQLAEAIAIADWRWWVNLEANIKAVTADDVKRVAEKYFVKRNETVGYYYPTKKPASNEPATPSTPPGASSLLDVPASYVVAQAPADTNIKPTASSVGSPAASSVGSGDIRTETTVNAVGSKDMHTETTVNTVSSTATSSTHASIASQVQKKVLANGMTILVLPMPGSKVVSIAGKIKAGDYFHPPGIYSIPDFVADMLDKGSEHWTKDALAQQLETMGTTLDFGAGHFSLDFQSDLVTEDVPQYMALLSDTLQRPTFANSELDKEKKQHLADITAATTDADQVAANAFYRAVYKPNCVYYQQPFNEQMSEVSKVTVDGLKAFHKAHVNPANTVLAVVGDIEPKVAFDLVDKEFAGWSGPPADKIDVSDCASAAVQAKRINNPLPDKVNVDVLMGSPSALSIKSPDFYAASLANAALGHDTISSRLAEIRQKHGLTYGISSYFSENQYENGPWIINFTVNPTNLPKAIPLIDKIVADYAAKGMTEHELDEESKRLAGEYIVERMRTPHSLADAITKYEMLGLGAKFMDEYPKRLRQVTLGEANAAIKKYFDLSHMVMSVAGTIDGGDKK